MLVTSGSTSALNVPLPSASRQILSSSVFSGVVPLIVYVDAVVQAATFGLSTVGAVGVIESAPVPVVKPDVLALPISLPARSEDRKSTRLNSSHSQISYAVF